MQTMLRLHWVFLFSFLDKNYSNKDKEKIKSSLSVFWDTYVNDKYPSKDDVLIAIGMCLSDLSYKIYNKREDWSSRISLTPKRKNKYENIFDDLLKKEVHESDAIIILDAHDYNLGLEEKLDFITFDHKFLDGILQIKDFSFNEILGKNDFI